MNVRARTHQYAPTIRHAGQVAVLGTLLAVAFGTGLALERWQNPSESPALPAPVAVAPTFSASELLVPSLATQAELGRLAGSAPLTPSGVAVPAGPVAPAVVPSEARARELAIEAGSSPISTGSLAGASHPIVPSAESQARLAAEGMSSPGSIVLNEDRIRESESRLEAEAPIAP